MTKQLRKEIVALLNEKPTTHGDQGSALGIARRSLDADAAKFEPAPTQNPNNYVMRNRDRLALVLIEVLKDVPREPALDALAYARDLINAPFRDETMAAWRVAREERGQLGELKKVRAEKKS
jgi:hypothetical protein